MFCNRSSFVCAACCNVLLAEPVDLILGAGGHHEDAPGGELLQPDLCDEEVASSCSASDTDDEVSEDGDNDDAEVCNFLFKTSLHAIRSLL